MRILFLVTARGGSKGVPRKNLQTIAGLPLVAYKIISARRTRAEGRILCSTDSPEIADVARRFGAEVPFLRPAELATDEASSADVLLHAMDWLEAHDPKRFDAVLLLEPSSPFATYVDFQRAIETFERLRPDSVVSVRPTEVSSIYVETLGPGGRMDRHFAKMKAARNPRRQDRPVEYTMNGALYLIDWDFLRRNRSVYGENTYAHIMPRELSVEIETPDDLHFGRFLAEKGLIDLSFWTLEGVPAPDPRAKD